jgi:hypothetical protein
MKTIFILLISIGLIPKTTPLDYKKSLMQFDISLINARSLNKLVYKKINKDERFQSRFLGTIMSGAHQPYYIVTSSYIFNIKNSPTAESELFVFDMKKQCVGYYSIPLLDELPQKITNDQLLFKVAGSRKPLSVSFKKGIPKAITLKSNDGDDFCEFKAIGE